MKWLDKILNLSKEPNVYSNFPSLMKIETLPTSQRSSRVLQAKKDVLTLKKEDAINCLAKNISSPATKVWGGLLFDLSADWNCLRGWMDISKLHALAAADAINSAKAAVEKRIISGRSIFLSNVIFPTVEINLEWIMWKHSTSPQNKKTQGINLESPYE